MLVKTRDEVSELLGQRALQRLRAMSELCGPVRYAPPLQQQQQQQQHHCPPGAGAAIPDAAVAAAVPSSLLDPGTASLRATRRLCKPVPGFRRGYGGGGGGGGVRRRRPLAPLAHAPPRGLPATCTLRGPVRQPPPPPPPLPGPPSPSACKKVLPPLPAAAAAAAAAPEGAAGRDSKNPMAGGRAWVGKDAPVNERDRDAPTTDSVIMQWCMVLESAKAEQGLSGEDATLDMVEDLRVRRVRAGERRRSSVAVVASRSHPDVQAPTPSGVEVAAAAAAVVPPPLAPASAETQGSLAAPSHAQPRSSRVFSCVVLEEARRPSAAVSSSPPPPPLSPPPPAPAAAAAAADGGPSKKPVTMALAVPARVDDALEAGSGGGGCRRWECDGRQVAVHALPELESAVVARLDYGDVVEEIDRKSEWVRCVAGWVRSCNPRIKAELYLKELVDHESPLEGSSLMYNELDKITERVRSLVC